MGNESQLAEAPAPKTTPAVRRHPSLYNSRNRKKFLTMNVAVAVGSMAPASVVGAIIMAVTTVAPFIMMATIYGYSRDLEREADLKGIDMMISAEYAPE